MSKPSWKPPLIPARLPGWERAYVEVLGAHNAQAFAWGVSDCLIVAADLCLAMTGVDPMQKLRRYSTEAGALRRLVKLGFNTVEDALEATFPVVPLARARRGDCAVLEQVVDGRPWLSTLIIMGDRAVGKGPQGPAYVATASLRRAFSIGAV